MVNKQTFAVHSTRLYVRLLRYSHRTCCFRQVPGFLLRGHAFTMSPARWEGGDCACLCVLVAPKSCGVLITLSWWRSIRKTNNALVKRIQSSFAAAWDTWLGNSILGLGVGRNSRGLRGHAPLIRRKLDPKDAIEPGEYLRAEVYTPTGWALIPTSTT